MKILAKDFSTRAALEREASGKDAAKDTIEGTREDLAVHGLSDQSTVFGIKVVITDTPTQKEILAERPDRGLTQKGSILGK